MIYDIAVTVNKNNNNNNFVLQRTQYWYKIMQYYCNGYKL